MKKVHRLARLGGAPDRNAHARQGRTAGMGPHTFPVDRVDVLLDPSRYRFCSREELIDMIDPAATDHLLDIGAGPGFYTADVAPFVARVYALDIQPAMHAVHRERGVARNIALVTGDAATMPFATGSMDGAFSIMTHHEFTSEAALADVARVLRPGARLVTVDWSATGTGEDGPPIAERYAPSAIVEQLEAAGMTVVTCRERPETVAVVARAG